MHLNNSSQQMRHIPLYMPGRTLDFLKVIQVTTTLDFLSRSFSSKYDFEDLSFFDSMIT